MILLLSYNNSYVKFEADQAVPHFSLVFLGSSWSLIYLFTPGKGLLFASSSSEASGLAGCGVHLCGGGLGPAEGEQQEPLNLRE